MVEVRHGRIRIVEHGHAVGDLTVSETQTSGERAGEAVSSPRGRVPDGSAVLVDDAADAHQRPDAALPAAMRATAARAMAKLAMKADGIRGPTVVRRWLCGMPARQWTAVRCHAVCGFRYAGDMAGLVASRGMRVLVVEDEPYMAEAIRDGLRLEAIAADIAGDGDTALELLSINAYDIAIVDRDIPGPSGDVVASHIVASDSGMPILMLTAADRLDDKASGFGLGADDYLTKPFADLRELVLRLRALDRRRAHQPAARARDRGTAAGSLPPRGLPRRPVRRADPEAVRRAGAPRRRRAAAWSAPKSSSARAWDENADPFTNAVRITVSALRKRLGGTMADRHGARRRLPHRRWGGQRRHWRRAWIGSPG